MKLKTHCTASVAPETILQLARNQDKATSTLDLRQNTETQTLEPELQRRPPATLLPRLRPAGPDS